MSQCQTLLHNTGFHPVYDWFYFVNDQCENSQNPTVRDPTRGTQVLLNSVFPKVVFLWAELAEMAASILTFSDSDQNVLLKIAHNSQPGSYLEARIIYFIVR